MIGSPPPKNPSLFRVLVGRNIRNRRLASRPCRWPELDVDNAVLDGASPVAARSTISSMNYVVQLAPKRAL
jgi:hypothetical protein